MANSAIIIITARMHCPWLGPFYLLIESLCCSLARGPFLESPGNFSGP